MIIGLTGGIGSGKSTVANIFLHLGIPVFIADEESKRILDTDSILQNSLRNLLGKELIKDGVIDKVYMAQKIFSDESLLQEVNALLHPLVGIAFKNWALQHSKAPYVMREAAILFESNTFKDCDKIVVVTAPESLRLERVMRRSNLSAEAVKARMNKQWSQEKKDAMADYLVDNSGEKSLIKQVIAIHENIIGRTK
jgi:dephospho-CoA kinase